MMKIKTSLLLSVMLLAVLFVPCVGSGEAASVAATEESTQSQDGGTQGRDYSVFAGTDIAVITGVLTYNTTEKIGAKPMNYSDSASAAEDVRQGRVSGYMHALTAVQVMASQLDGFEAIPVPKEIFAAQIGGISMDERVIGRFNEFLALIETDGTLSDMKDRWFGEGMDLDAPIPAIENTGENGTLKVATCSDAIPYVYMGANEKLTGFSAELALRFGAYEKKTVEFIDMEFGGLIPYIVSGKADIGLANMAITEERKKSVLFTQPFFEEQHGILALKSETPAKTASYTDYIDAEKRLAVIAGDVVFEDLSQDVFKTKAELYPSAPEMIEAVRLGKADAGFIVSHAVKELQDSGMYEDMQFLDIPENLFLAEAAHIFHDEKLRDTYNEWLREAFADGTIAEISRRWLGVSLPAAEDIPKIDLTGENGTLKICDTGALAPFCYIGANGQPVGFNVEIVSHFAQYMGMNIEFSLMAYDAIVPYVISGKADMSSCSITVTEERKKNVFFGETLVTGHAVLVAPYAQEDAVPAQKGGFMEWLKTGIQRNLITDNRWKMIVSGLGVTLVIALASQFFGTVFGCFVCWLLMRGSRIIRGLANLYCGLINGTPMVVLLMITYYIIFGNTSISNVLVAIAAFTMVTGAGIAGTLHGAIETVDPVEIEAARSMGFSAFRAFLTVTLPQAVRRALPGYTMGFIELVKATAIVGYIAIQDLTRAGDIIRSRTYDAYFPLLFVAFIYLIITTICVQLFKLVVRKVNGRVRV